MGYILVSCSYQRKERKSPSTDCFNRGKTLFRDFHNFPASSLIRGPCQRMIPRVLVKLGLLRAVIYESDRGQPGCQQTYIHFMEKPPLLTCDPNGSHLYVIGGHYRVTPRGIEG